MSSDSKAMPWDIPRFRNWIAVARVSQLVRKDLGDALLEKGLDLPSYDVLSISYRYPGLTQSDLAEKLLVGRSNLSMLLPEMEAQAWLKRKADDQDKRVRRVFLTPLGERHAKAGLKLQLKLVEHMMMAVDDEECDALGATMRKISGYLADHPFET